MIACVIDLGLGNISCVTSSVKRALVDERFSFLCVASPNELSHIPSHIILPGVGTFSEGMQRLNSTGWSDYIARNCIDSPRCSLLGICLGMQMLASIGYEGSRTLTGIPGMDIIGGSVEHLSTISTECSIRIPHIGWNDVVFTSSGSLLFEGISNSTDFYFMHSYAVASVNPSYILARCDQSTGSFICAVNRDKCFGVQFHPEKSQSAGSRMMRNFLELC